MNGIGATLANAKQYQQALSIYSDLIAQGFEYPRIYYNQAISYLSLEQYTTAAQLFIKAYELQAHADVSQIKSELSDNYQTPLEGLKITLSIARRDDLLEPFDLERIKRSL